MFKGDVDRQGHLSVYSGSASLEPQGASVCIVLPELSCVDTKKGRNSGNRIVLFGIAIHHIQTTTRNSAPHKIRDRLVQKAQHRSHLYVQVI